MKEEEIKIGENIIKVVTSQVLPENLTLFINPKNAEKLKKMIKIVEKGAKEKDGRVNKNS